MTNGFLTYLIDLSPYYLACAVIGYLIGSIPFGYIMVRLIKGIDIRTVGSGNIGATNVGRVLGIPAGILCFLLDTAKGLFTTVLIPHIIIKILQYRLGIPFCLSWCGTCREAHERCPLELQVIIGLFIIIGHLFPVYIRFKGGKGVATGLGVFWVIAPNSTLIALVVWLIFFMPLRYISLASIMAVISLIISPFFIDNDSYRIYLQDLWEWPMFLWGFQSGLFVIIACCIIAGLVILRHIPNIKRLIKGTEPKVRLWRKQ